MSVPRYSLRTLLVITTLICAAAVYLGYMYRTIIHFERAAQTARQEAIRKEAEVRRSQADHAAYAAEVTATQQQDEIGE